MVGKDSIISLPDKHLRKRSAKVSALTPELEKIIDDMKTATLDWEASRPHEVGVALAAIQIDQPYRIVIVRNNFDDKEDRSFNVYINPEVIKLDGDVEEDYEGCLSVKDVYGKVPRHSKLRMKALDESGQPIRVRAEGFLARVLQHEIDHVNGIVFIDHIKNKPGAFFRLKDDGKLDKLDYEQVKKTGIFRD